MSAANARDPLDVDLRALARTGTVHFVGIAGAGMSAIAELLLRTGGRVTGCDVSPGAVGEMLGAQGAQVFSGHDAAHIAEAAAVVTTAAVPSHHAELEAARRRGIPVIKRAHALGSIVNRGMLLAIAGTHGKTTTTAMATAILAEAGLNPTGFVGGHVTAWSSGLRAGSDTLFVVEADEYDRSFMSLRPTTAVITSVEADHLDIFGSADEVEEAFRRFVALVPDEGTVVACADDSGAARVVARRLGTLTYGTSAPARLRAEHLEPHGRATRFTVREGGMTLGDMTVNAPGIHNVRNALGAFAAARSAGADFDSARRALGAFTGVARRLQDLGTFGGVTVIDDYAHHPTEISATIAACRSLFSGRPIIALFQPHLYTRTRDFAPAFGAALAAADAVWVAGIYPAREEPIAGVDGGLIADAARRAGARNARHVADLEAIGRAVLGTLRAGDVLLVMGAGDIDRAARAIVAGLREEQTA
ncbi:MAG: UDP-N-acetylmuramate--L-alanine ligase [Gemmatimonadetes bacterium]|nr:UDP-N-acetylmuramate--L-alanine ligase [Gemmatimonadota bacterium]